MARILNQFNDVVRRADYIEPCINVAAPTAWRGDRDSGRVIERMGLVAGIDKGSAHRMPGPGMGDFGHWWVWRYVEIHGLV